MTTHVEDGAIVRYLDEACENGERDEVRGHLDDCAVCAGRLTELRARARAVSIALRALDPPRARAGPRPRWALRAAAAVLVLLGIAGTVRPVRAWIVERAAALWAAVTGGAADDAPAPPGSSGAGGETIVSFVPGSEPFTIAFARRQAAGSVTIEGVAGDTARVGVLGGSGADDILVLPGGLRIVNAPTAGVSYVIRLPRRLVSVAVAVGEEPARPVRLGGPAVAIDLRAR